MQFVLSASPQGFLAGLSLRSATAAPLRPSFFPKTPQESPARIVDIPARPVDAPASDLADSTFQRRARQPALIDERPSSAIRSGNYAPPRKPGQAPALMAAYKTPGQELDVYA